MRNGFAGIGALALIAVGVVASSAGSTPAAAATSAARVPLVSFFRPTGDTLVEKGTGPIRVIVHLRPGARLTRVDVDGVDLTRLLTRGPGGYWGAIVNVDRKLHYGFNDAFATATGRDGSRGTAHVRFIVAKRDDRLLRVTGFRIQTSAAPLQVALRETTGTNVRAALSVAQGVSVRVYVNDRRVDRAFSYSGGRLAVRLGASEGLRFGRNLVQILVHRTHPYKRQSSYDIESRIVQIARNAPIASAGADQTITQGELVRFDGLATKLPPGFPRPSFRWRIASAPPGSKARLRNASSIRPTLVPVRPGVYAVRVTVRATRARSSRRIAFTASQAGVSSDTTTLTVQPGSPVGVPLETLTPGYYYREMRLDGKQVPGTDTHDDTINYAIIDRQTLEIASSGAVGADVDGINELATKLDGYTGQLNYLVVLNWYGFRRHTDIGANRNAMDALLQKIGEPALTAVQRDRLTTLSGDGEAIRGSAIGVAGAPAGSGFENFGREYNGGGGSLSGYLRENHAISKYDFVFTDAVGFDTAPNQTATDNSPAQLTIKVGDTDYTQPNPGGGTSGFHLLVLNANTLEALHEGVYTTNASSRISAVQPDEVQRLADDLAGAVNNPDRPLVILQAFGAPFGYSDAWYEAAKQIERLGGTSQVFIALNSISPKPLNGEDSKRKGPYAFVGRVGSTAPLAEQSYPLTGQPGRLEGVLMRAHDGGYEPMLAGPPRSDGQPPVNTELIRITNQPPQPFPAFKDANGNPVAPPQALAVQNFLGGPNGVKLCSDSAVAAGLCQFRKLYYQSYDNADWSVIETRLTSANDKCAQPPQGSTFTAAQCQGVRVQLRDEVADVASVKAYFDGLQQPFGAAGVTALANLNQISQDIEAAVQPPPADNATSNTLAMIGQILFPTPTTPYPGAFSALSAAFSLAGYFTKENGAPNLIGPQVTTAASKLGVELADRYNQAGDNLDDVGRLIVSDYGKLTAVADRVDAVPGPGEMDWRLGDVGQARNTLAAAAKRTIYERLIPVAYPVMYDLGEGFPNARDWWCQRPQKYLFGDQPDSAQFRGRYRISGQPGYSPIIAVAQVHATGHGDEARIRGIPASIADPLFQPVAQGGLGLAKLQFFSPRNGFRYFPPQPTRSSTPVEGIAGNTLHEFPYPDLNQFFSSTDHILCEDIPDPPYNAGP